MSARRSRVRHSVATISLSAVLCAGLTACQTSADRQAAGTEPTEPAAASASVSETAEPTVAPEPVEVSTEVGPNAQAVPVDQSVRVTAAGGTLATVEITSPAGPLAGELADDSTSWVADSRLEPGTTYDVSTVAARSDGKTRKVSSSFTTQPLTLDQQTYASIAPLDGETVGVGMPVIVNFDIPVTDRASIEKHLSVESTPKQRGAWHWMSDTQVNYRPAKYWQTGTKVEVDADINSIPAGAGIFGQESRSMSFKVGDSVISKVDAQTFQMKTFINGELARTTPITTGKAGFTTRSGVKVIMEKFASKRMNSETVGIPSGSSEAYDIDNVQYAMRVTNSGEFLHAAPWSVGSQGYANVSHGCTGMSTDNAAWIYNNSKRGDVVEYTGTDRPMTLDNGYGDWNASFKDYKLASALKS